MSDFSQDPAPQGSTDWLSSGAEQRSTGQSSTAPVAAATGTAPRPGSAGSTSLDSSPASSGSASTTETAKGEAKQVADTAVSSGKEVAATAQEEAKNVAAEAKEQAGSLLDTVRTEVSQQARTSQNRIADALHGLSSELGGMASGSQESGPLTDLAHQASRKGGEVAHWLQDREPSDVLEEVRSYARRRPGTFLVLCGLAGVVAGRLTRSAVASRTSLDSRDDDELGRSRGDAGDGHTTERAHYVTTDGGAGSGTTSVGTGDATAPEGGSATGRTAGGPSTGVYGGSLETTEPAGGAVGDPALPGSGAPDPLNDPDGDRIR